MSYFGDMKYYHEVAAGRVPNSTAGFVIGINRNVSNIEEHFVADQGGFDVDLVGNTQLYVSSDDALDTNVAILGSFLDEDYEPVTLTATTNGQTQVALSAATAFKTLVVLVTGSASPVGNLYIAESDTLTGGVPDTASKIKAIIPLSEASDGTPTGTGTAFASDNISHLGQTTVPAGKRLFIVKIILGTDKDDDIKIQGRVRFLGGPWLNRNPIPIYQSNVPVEFDFPLNLPPKTDLQFRATSGTSGGLAQVQMFFVLEDDPV